MSAALFLSRTLRCGCFSRQVRSCRRWSCG